MAQVNWKTSYDAGLSEARTSARPFLVDFFHPG